jgi:hypothetical protein
MWDNRTTKKNPKAPDYKCKNKECDGAYWPGQWPPAKVSSPPSTEGEPPPPEPEDGGPTEEPVDQSVTERVAVDSQLKAAWKAVHDATDALGWEQKYRTGYANTWANDKCHVTKENMTVEQVRLFEAHLITKVDEKSAEKLPS